MVKKKKNSKRIFNIDGTIYLLPSGKGLFKPDDVSVDEIIISRHFLNGCLLYTSPSPRDS